MKRVLDSIVFRGVGTTCRIVVSTSPLELPVARRAAAAARAEVEACERVLSRFAPDSDVSRVNAAAGSWVAVDPRLVAALETALRLRELTGGLCDPTLLPALAAAGYDRSFELLEPHDAGTVAELSREVELDAQEQRVRVAVSAAIDLGATAKGFIAGRAVDAAVRTWPGAPGILVDLGGDLAVAGSPPDGDAWRVDVEHPQRQDECVGTLLVTEGGVATSGPLRRRFGPNGSLNHLIHPVELRPSAGAIAAATAVAADPAAADGHATALALLSPADAEEYVAARRGLGAVVVCRDGRVEALGDVPFTPAPSRFEAAAR